VLLLEDSFKLYPSRLFCVRQLSPLRPLYRPSSTSGSFLASSCDELLTPPSMSVFGMHAIGFLLATIIHIVCFFNFFSCIVSFLLVFLFFPSCCLIFHFIPLFPYTFSFMFLLLIRLYSFSLICPFLLWSSPWVVDVNDFLAFELRMMSFDRRILLSGPRNKHYLCIGWYLFSADLIVNFDIQMLLVMVD
jgi:hypothetical protein